MSETNLPPVNPDYYADLLEYHTLKTEQMKRIEYRDQMVHVHLGLVGAAAAWALEHESAYTFLLIPWLCLIMGWAYLFNDDRISAIGAYIRTHLAPRVGRPGPNPRGGVFGWEYAHRADRRRVERKVWQFVSDELEFVVSGFLALFAFYRLRHEVHLGLWLMVIAEAVMLLALGTQIFRYTEFGSGAGLEQPPRHAGPDTGPGSPPGTSGRAAIAGASAPAEAGQVAPPPPSDGAHG